MKTINNQPIITSLNKLEQREQLTNFLNEDLNNLQELLNQDNTKELNEELQRFIYYWQQHSKTFKD